MSWSLGPDSVWEGIGGASPILFWRHHSNMDAGSTAHRWVQEPHETWVPCCSGDPEWPRAPDAGAVWKRGKMDPGAPWEAPALPSRMSGPHRSGTKAYDISRLTKCAQPWVTLRTLLQIAPVERCRCYWSLVDCSGRLCRPAGGDATARRDHESDKFSAAGASGHRRRAAIRLVCCHCTVASC